MIKYNDKIQCLIQCFLTYFKEIFSVCTGVFSLLFLLVYENVIILKLDTEIDGKYWTCMFLMPIIQHSEKKNYNNAYWISVVN